MWHNNSRIPYTFEAKKKANCSIGYIRCLLVCIWAANQVQDIIVLAVGYRHRSFICVDLGCESKEWERITLQFNSAVAWFVRIKSVSKWTTEKNNHTQIHKTKTELYLRGARDPVSVGYAITGLSRPLVPIIKLRELDNPLPLPSSQDPMLWCG